MLALALALAGCVARYELRSADDPREMTLRDLPAPAAPPAPPPSVSRNSTTINVR